MGGVLFFCFNTYIYVDKIFDLTAEAWLKCNLIFMVYTRICFVFSTIMVGVNIVPAHGVAGQGFLTGQYPTAAARIRRYHVVGVVVSGGCQIARIGLDWVGSS